MAFSQAEMDALVERIKPHGADIRKKADEGDAFCKNIMATYKMLRDRPEPGAFSILECMMDEYEADFERVDCGCLGLQHRLGCPNHEICL